MKHIQSIEINNFRGIQHLTLEGLSPITILLGENSVGKSTILESLFLITGLSNPFMAFSITSLRAHKTISMNDVKYMFHDADCQQIPSMEAVVGEEKRQLKLIPTFSIKDSIEVGRMAQMDNMRQPLTGLKCDFEVNSPVYAYSGTSSIERDKDGNLVPKVDANYKETVASISLSPYNLGGTFLDDYDELVKVGRKDVLLKALRLFDSRITAVESTTDGLFLGYVHLNRLVPISMAGDGVQKYLSIAMQAFRPSTNIILIDEIENGLHFTAHTKLWECIFTCASELGKQFFISTHSQETLRCLAAFLDRFPDKKDLVRVVTLTREKEIITPYYLSGDGLSGAMENDVEIRK